MTARWISLPLLLLALGSTAQAADCPAVLKEQGELPALRGKQTIDLCQRFAGKPLVVVNTASFCGFTSQFKGLEALNQQYKAQGLEVLGVPSNDFKQESGDGEETAKVCYVNYGVTFTMTEPQPVRGSDAIALFRNLAEQSDGAAPRWNFNKYVLDRQGKVVAHFGSTTKPDDPQLIAAIEKAIASKP
ncbi:glutathione peroxidase [Pseudomonas sp. 21LCFQ010]|uniref:glutathione peroxidase n=1 Tax=Pseudomonas sp. 21LCFQ010 TaxID=2957506 RepID=UPI002096F9ED|nr:glutathione peroxidase [Pseudomonas sp. 21LCFQ010]MCO8163060.1 glutathione peroxidase [Pseudomonas sp. 21LCFQ010]